MTGISAVASDKQSLQSRVSGGRNFKVWSQVLEGKDCLEVLP